MGQGLFRELPAAAWRRWKRRRSRGKGLEDGFRIQSLGIEEALF